MPNYEHVFLARQDVTSQQVEALTAQFKGVTVTFVGDKYTVKKGDEVIHAATLKLDPSKDYQPIVDMVKFNDTLRKTQ